MESYLNELLNNMDAGEVLLQRRLSPYATLRPGDLAALIGQFQRTTTSLGHCFLPDSPESEEESLPEETGSDVIVSAGDQGHVPAQYTVKGLQRHEMPVIGVYVDSRICPGFRYRVRRIGGGYKKHDFLWGGKARTLLSVGMGYGRRLTFQDDQLNNNECYFWSDSNPEGFAFSIEAVDEGQNFFIQSPDDGTILGEAYIENVHEPQEEEREATSSEVRGHVTKSVAVRLTCRITHYNKHHTGLLELMPHESLEKLEGCAKVVRSRGSPKATVRVVENVFLPRIGECVLVPEC